MWSDELRELVASPDAMCVNVKSANLRVYDEVARDHQGHVKQSTPHGHTDLLRAYRNLVTSLYRSNVGPKSVLADIGCATAEEIDCIPADWQAVAIDISMSNLRSVVSRRAIKIFGDAERLPLKAGSVSAIVCFAAIHHFPHLHQFFRGCKRVLTTRGGLLVAMEPHSRGLPRGPLAAFVFFLRKPLYRWLARLGFGNHFHTDAEIQRLNDIAEVQRSKGGFTKESLTALLHSCGLKIVKCWLGPDFYNQKTWVLPSLKHLIITSLSLRNPFSLLNSPSISVLAAPADD